MSAPDQHQRGPDVDEEIESEDIENNNDDKDDQGRVLKTEEIVDK